MNKIQTLGRRAALLAGVAAGALVLESRADELFVASPTTLISEGNPYGGSFTTIGACGGAAHSMTLNGAELLIGDPNGHIYRRSPGNFFVSYAYDVPNSAHALAMHANQLLSGGDNGTLVRVNASTGAVLASFTLSVPISAMVVSGDDVYVGSSFGIVQKGNALTGGFQFWGTCGGPVNSMVIDGTHLVLGASQGQVYRINLQTQAVDATFSIPNDATGMVLHLGDLVVGGSSGSLVRLQRFNGAVKSNLGAPASVGALALRATPDPGTGYCYGAGICPCNNNDPVAGCANSTGFGARLAGTGTASVSGDDLTIHAFQMPANKNGRFYMASVIVQMPFGDGLLCAGSGGYPIFRFPPANSGPSGSFATPANLVGWCNQNLPISGHIAPGSTWHFQAWYRDQQGPCGAHFNTTDALSVTFLP
jgi:hypothetical protein